MYGATRGPNVKWGHRFQMEGPGTPGPPRWRRPCLELLCIRLCGPRIKFGDHWFELFLVDKNHCQQNLFLSRGIQAGLCPSKEMISATSWSGLFRGGSNVPSPGNLGFILRWVPTIEWFVRGANVSSYQLTRLNISPILIWPLLRKLRNCFKSQTKASRLDPVWSRPRSFESICGLRERSPDIRSGRWDKSVMGHQIPACCSYGETNVKHCSNVICRWNDTHQWLTPWCVSRSPTSSHGWTTSCHLLVPHDRQWRHEGRWLEHNGHHCLPIEMGTIGALFSPRNYFCFYDISSHQLIRQQNSDSHILLHSVPVYVCSTSSTPRHDHIHMQQCSSEWEMCERGGGVATLQRALEILPLTVKGDKVSPRHEAIPTFAPNTPQVLTIMAFHAFSDRRRGGRGIPTRAFKRNDFASLLWRWTKQEKKIIAMYFCVATRFEGSVRTKLLGGGSSRLIMRCFGNGRIKNTKKKNDGPRSSFIEKWIWAKHHLLPQFSNQTPLKYLNVH